MIDKLNAHHTRGDVAPDSFTDTTLSMHFYDSVVVFEKGSIPGRDAVKVRRGRS